jgi:hypothetical protein
MRSEAGELAVDLRDPDVDVVPCEQTLRFFVGREALLEPAAELLQPRLVALLKSADLHRADCPSAGCPSVELLELLSQCELHGLVPCHGSSVVEGSAGSRLAEPGAGWNEVALAPRLG